MESVFYSNAQDCLDIFAQRLGDRKFLFGEHPSGLDAVLYSYLAPAAKLPLPDNRIKTILNGHANLTQFVENISKSYFLSYLASSSSTATASTSSEGASDAASPSTEAAKMRGNLWALLFAVTAMSGYAYTTGLYRAFKIDFID